MIKYILLFSAFILSCSSVYAQDIFGLWKTVDDETNLERSIVEIYKQDSKIYGMVIELLEADKKDSLCDLCPGVDKDKSITGINVIKGLIKKGNEYSGGKILDPNNGKLYKCTISLVDADKLKVRGYIGFSLIGRTQYWYRLK